MRPQKVSLVGKVCEKCGTDENLSRHHIHPTEFYAQEKDHNLKVEILCDACHRKLEQRIPHHQKMNEQFYETILNNFLNEKSS